MAHEPDQPPPSALERKLVTILSADVAEYSRLMAEDEEQTLRIFREHSQTFRSLVDSHRGRIFNTAGDAILAEFTSPVEAVRCATDIQAALRTRNDQLPPARQVKFRIGINLGDVMMQDSDLLGDGVNVAARLQGAAQPGGICVSGSVYDQIRNKLSLSFESLGERRFKNIPQPVRTFTITGTEDHGALPASRNSSGRLAALAKYAAALALVPALAGGYWTYSAYQRSQTHQSSAMPESNKHIASADSPALQRASVQPNAQTPASTAFLPKPADRSAETTQAVQASPGPATQQENRQRSKRKPIVSASLPSPQDQASAQAEPVRRDTPAVNRAAIQPGAISPAGTAGKDGVYIGQVCYGAGPRNPARCFRGRARVAHGEISGQWPIGPEGTMVLTGTVAAAGDVFIEAHPEDANGRRRGAANLSGTLQDGRLEATGKFLSGRTISFTWHRN